MLLKFKSVDISRVKPERMVDVIGTFKGMRYDSERKMAFLFIEEDRHGYVMPMDDVAYSSFMNRFYAMAAMALMRSNIIVCISGGFLLRTAPDTDVSMAPCLGFTYELMTEENNTDNTGRKYVWRGCYG